MRRALLAALCVLLLVPGAASAGRVTFDPMEAGRAAALLHWGGLPPCGEPHVIYGDPQGLLNGIVQDGSNAAAAAYTYADPVHGISACSIVWAPAIPLDPGETCALLVHEWGHLFGHKHTNDPNDVMYWRTLRFDQEWSCRQTIAWRPYARRCVRDPEVTVCTQVRGWSLRRPLAV